MELQPIGAGAAQIRYPKTDPRVKISVSDIALGDGGRVYPLKQLWRTSLGVSVARVSAGANGRAYVVARNEPVVLALSPEGKIDGEFRCSELYSLGEGSERVYVASKDNKLHAYDKSGHKLWERKWPRNNNYWPSSASPSPPVEDKQGNIWLTDDNVVYKFPADGGPVQRVPIDGWSSTSTAIVDGNGNVYTKNGKHVRVSPDMSVKTIDGNPDYFFIARNHPYSIVGEKLYRLDFDSGARQSDPATERADGEGEKKEILHWRNDKKALAPVVTQDGNIHLLLKGNDDKSSLYVVVNPRGYRLPGGQVQYVKWRKPLPFGLDKVAPAITPNGTLYAVAQEKRTNFYTWYYSLVAIDRNGNFHSMDLGREEPCGLINGAGESMMAVFKDGTVVCVEAKSTQEILEEKKREEMDRNTLEKLGKGQPFKK